MQRNQFLRLVIALVGGLASCGAVSAQSFGSRIGHFQILPKHSVLERTGGIAGVSERLRVSGSYDLQILPPAVFPPMVGFDDAEVWRALISDLPHPAFVEDVDQLLNLAGLRGRQLPVAAPFDAYEFKGQTQDGSAIKLHAAVLGPWMYVRGGTTPPPGSADFFEYELSMIARSRPFADLNEDGVVDSADYTLLRDASGGGAAALASTAGITFDDWRQQFGERIPDFTAVDRHFAGTASSFAAAGAVPEPAAATMALLAGTATLSVRRRPS